MFGLLVAFGALILRLQDVLFGEPSGPPGEVKATYVPLFLHLAFVLIGGPVAARAGGALVPCRGRAIGMTVMSERLAKLIAERTPVPGHRPWPRYEVDEAAWIAIAQALGKGGGDLLGLWGEKDNVHLAMRVAGAARAVRRLAAAEEPTFLRSAAIIRRRIRLERAVRDLYGAASFGFAGPAAVARSWRLGIRAPLGARAPSVRPQRRRV